MYAASLMVGMNFGFAGVTPQLQIRRSWFDKTTKQWHTCFMFSSGSPGGWSLFNKRHYFKSAKEKMELFVPPCLPITQTELRPAAGQNGPKRTHPATYSYRSDCTGETPLCKWRLNTFRTRFHLGQIKQNKNMFSSIILGLC